MEERGYSFNLRNIDMLKDACGSGIVSKRTHGSGTCDGDPLWLRKSRSDASG